MRSPRASSPGSGRTVAGGGDESHRRAAAAGLGALGERSAPVLAALRAASVSADPSLRRAAEGALRQLGAE